MAALYGTRLLLLVDKVAFEVMPRRIERSLGKALRVFAIGQLCMEVADSRLIASVTQYFIEVVS